MAANSVLAAVTPAMNLLIAQTSPTFNLLNAIKLPCPPLTDIR